MAELVKERNRFARRFDWLFALRPTLIFPLWTLVLAGNRMVVGKTELSPRDWAGFAVALTALFGLVYMLNEMRDREGDRKNGKLLLVANDLLSRSAQIAIAIVLAVVGSVIIVISGFGRIGLLVIIGVAFGGVLYNYSPLALKNSPWGGIISGAVGGWLLLRVGEALSGQYASLIAESPYILAFTAGCLLTGLLDVKGDMETGKRTFVVAYGERTTMGVAAALIALAGILAAILNDWVMVTAALGGGLLVGWGWLSATASHAVIGNKIAMLLLAVGIGLSYPVFLVAVLLYYPFARWYYRARFSIEYPSFKAG